MEAASPPPTVLIVDDDKGLARLIEKAVRREGYATAIALSGEETLAWLKEHRPDLMLLDLKLPDFHGKDLIERLEIIHDHVPFIIITGQGDERVAVDMMKRGALDYLVKDDQFLEFVPAVVRRTLAQLEREKRLRYAEESLRAKESQLALITDISPVALSQCSRDLRYIFVNRAYAQMLQRRPEEIMGRPIVEILGAEAYASMLPHIKKVLRGEMVNYAMQIPLPGAGPRYLQASYRPQNNKSGEIEGWVEAISDITERKKLEEALLRATEEEQQRIGRDLHDSLGQEMTAIAMLNSLLHSKLKAKALPEAADAEKIAVSLRRAGSQVRRVSHGLQPIAREPESLFMALNILVEDAKFANGSRCVFEYDEDVAVHNYESANHLYRIAQEAFQNALRHGDPHQVIIRLVRSGRRVILEVQDDGAGFDLKKIKSGGIGLSTMNYRAEAMNGLLEFVQPAGGGTLVRCSVPDAQPAT